MVRAEATGRERKEMMSKRYGTITQSSVESSVRILVPSE